MLLKLRMCDENLEYSLRFITFLTAKPRRFINVKGHEIRLLFMLHQRRPRLHFLEGKSVCTMN